jgi:hypothetical protein
MTINDIEDVFGKEKYPENGFPLEERQSEWEYIYDGLRGKDWHDLAIEDLDAMSGTDEGISCLSADTFVYFLPGLINLVLKDASANRYRIVTCIADRLARPDHLYQVTGRGDERRRQQKELEWLLADAMADEEAIFELLSPRQRQFLIKFMRDALQAEPTMCPIVVNSAIHNLEQGKVEPYRQDDVRLWADSTLAKMGTHGRSLRP